MQLGERYRVYYEELLDCLRHQRQKDLDGRPEGEFHFIVPSFFNLLKYLKDNKRTFTVVFRTFGQDLPEVPLCSLSKNLGFLAPSPLILLQLVQQFDDFCEGKHSLFPDVILDGSDGGVDYRVSSI